MNTKMLLSAAAIALLSMSGAASAAEAMATTDLNVRAGPGPQYPVIGVLAAGQSTTVRGCLQSGSWCAISNGGEEGWAYSDYLATESAGSRVVLTERPASSEIAVIEAPDGGGEGALVGGATGAVTGALIGGPVGAAVGGVAGVALGGAAGEAAEPPAEVRQYVTSNRMEPVYLDGEVVVGAQVPETVALQEIPDYDYRYVYVNSQPVLVDPGTRQIVYVVR